MTAAREVVSSSYMHWAKTSSTAKFNLATSGLGEFETARTSCLARRSRDH